MIIIKKRKMVYLWIFINQMEPRRIVFLASRRIEHDLTDAKQRRITSRREKERASVSQRMKLHWRRENNLNK